MLVFFSSRRRHTRYWRDWSSDVCSSDLGLWVAPDEMIWGALGRSLWEDGDLRIYGDRTQLFGLVYPALIGAPLAFLALEDRSEERRVGKEGRSRWSPYH